MLQFIMPSITHRSVTNKDDIRVIMAVKQLEKYKKKKLLGVNSITLTDDEIINEMRTISNIVNEFLTKVGISVIKEFDNIVPAKDTEIRQIAYSDIKTKAGIKDKNDIIWIKFNKSGCISVVGCGCDIFFTDVSKANTSSGKINEYLGEYWYEKYVLIFPLIGIEKLDLFNRSDIESGIGNYLISKDVPILDYYSHNY